MKDREPVRIAAILIVVLVAVSVSLAFYLPRWKLWELVDASDVIMTGTVQSIDSYHNTSPDEIFTLITVDVDTLIKGTVGDASVIVREMGGTVDSISEYVTGTSRWAVEERVLLFLKPASDPTQYLTVNSTQGKLSILADSDDEDALFWYPAVEYTETLEPDSLEPAFLGEQQKLSDMIAAIAALL